LKLSKNGVPQWYQLLRYGGGSFWGVSQLASDGQGNTYIAGTFPSTVTIGTKTLSSSNLYNSMIIKINPEGVIVWTKVIPNVPEIIDMKVNDRGNLLFYTHLSGIVTIDNLTYNVDATKSFGFLLS